MSAHRRAEAIQESWVAFLNAPRPSTNSEADNQYEAHAAGWRAAEAHIVETIKEDSGSS